MLNRGKNSRRSFAGRCGELNLNSSFWKSSSFRKTVSCSSLSQTFEEFPSATILSLTPRPLLSLIFISSAVDCVCVRAGTSLKRIRLVLLKGFFEGKCICISKCLGCLKGEPLISAPPRPGCLYNLLACTLDERPPGDCVALLLSGRVSQRLNILHVANLGLMAVAAMTGWRSRKGCCFTNWCRVSVTRRAAVVIPAHDSL